MSQKIVNALKELLEKHKSKRVSVLGTTCTGKSTILARIENAVDQDDEVFPRLAKMERAYVCQTPWTEEIGNTMNQLVRDKVCIEPGKPVFGTVVIDCDHIVFLKISDALLRERVAKRKASYEDAKNMQKRIEEEILSSGIPCTEFCIG